MRRLVSISLAGLIAISVAACARTTARVGVGIGPAPDCPYGYFDAPPYECAPAGYYGPEWFSGDVFIGAGPWFHGRRDFRGSVDNRLHPDHGYRGPMPSRGEKAEQGRRADGAHFQGNETRDGRGHVVAKKR